MIRPLRVLLVEDNEADAELTRETLESSKIRIDLEVVNDGLAAIAYLLRRPPFEKARGPDVILLDLNLPKMDGRQVLAEIKQHEDLLQIPVVILTSSDADKDIARSYKLGANCYVTKPVGLEAFQSIVRSIESFWFMLVKLP